MDHQSIDSPMIYIAFVECETNTPCDLIFVDSANLKFRVFLQSHIIL
jgi:hypothetical protein